MRKPSDLITDPESLKLKTSITGTSSDDNEKKEVEFAIPIKVFI